MSVTHWLLVALVVLVLFGGSKLGDIGKGLGEGIKNFKKGLADDDKPDERPRVEPPRVTDARVVEENRETPPTAKKQDES
jgi:sec-independent protein translocase protein TatA